MVNSKVALEWFSKQMLRPVLRGETLKRSLHLMILFGLAFAQPLYDVTSKQAEFW